jgi:hypothetical protein
LPYRTFELHLFDVRPYAQQLQEIHHFASRNEEELEQQKKKVRFCFYLKSWFSASHRFLST